MTCLTRVVRSRRWAIVAASAVLVGLALAGTAFSTTNSPGGLILFNDEVGDQGHLYSIRPDGTGLRQLTQGPSISWNGDWSPDGRTIVFEHIAADESYAGVSLMNADGTNVRELTPTGFQGSPAFTPDGRLITYTRDLSPSDNGVWLMGADGRDQRRVTRNPFMRDGNCGCDGHVKAAPDGKTLAFVRTKVDHVTQGLFTVRLDGTGLKQVLPYTPDVGVFLDWSPDGKRIAVTIGADPAAGKSANVAIVRPDGSDLRWVTHLTGGTRNAYVGGYSPDGKWLAIRIDDGVRHGLYIVHPDGKGLRRIATSRNQQRGIDWGKEPQ